MDIQRITPVDFYVDSVDFKPWTLTQTFTGLSLVVAAYLLTILKIIPSIVKDREPFKLRRVLLAYNVFQVAFSAYLLYETVAYLIQYGIMGTSCPIGKHFEFLMHCQTVYFIAKHLDLLDTCFFALRKKYNQITFLHVYHHAAMITWSWIMCTYHPSDQYVFPGMFNSFIHVLMYAYYGIASLGPKYAKFIWWKKYLTSMQLIQFIMLLIHFTINAFWSPCPQILPMVIFSIGNIALFLLLFLNFYLQSYITKRSE